MQVGDCVVVFGLQSRADLNECSATILTRLDGGRHQVQMCTTAGSEKVKVKPGNLRGAAAGPTAIVSAASAPPKDPPRGVLKALQEFEKEVWLGSPNTPITESAVTRRMRTSGQVDIKMLKYVDEAMAPEIMRAGGKRVLMLGIGFEIGSCDGRTVGSRDNAGGLGRMRWRREMNSWSPTDWAWFAVLVMHRSNVLPQINSDCSCTLLPSWKYHAADPVGFSAQMEHAVRIVAAMPRFSNDSNSCFYGFADHADLGLFFKFNSVNFDINCDAAWLFDTSWHWVRAGALLGIQLEDHSARPAVTYKFGDLRKVLTADGRWFESEQEYVHHRVAHAAVDVAADDVQQISAMLCELAKADQSLNNMTHDEKVKAYLGRSKHRPESKALRGAYVKYGIAMPEMHEAGVLRRCAQCQAVELRGKFKGCPCLTVWYCSRECQVTHWKASHKHECKRSPDAANQSRPATASINSAFASEVNHRERQQEERETLMRREFSRVMAGEEPRLIGRPL